MYKMYAMSHIYTDEVVLKDVCAELRMANTTIVEKEALHFLNQNIQSGRNLQV